MQDANKDKEVTTAHKNAMMEASRSLQRSARHYQEKGYAMNTDVSDTCTYICSSCNIHFVGVADNIFLIKHCLEWPHLHRRYVLQYTTMSA